MFIAHEIRENVDIEDVDAFITLDYEGRFLRRKMLRTDEGEVFLVELSETASLSSEDGLLLNDGRLIGILPKPEKLFKVRHDNLARIAWHIGNRHTPCQMEDDFLLIKEDHVIEKNAPSTELYT